MSPKINHCIYQNLHSKNAYYFICTKNLPFLFSVSPLLVSQKIFSAVSCITKLARKKIATISQGRKSSPSGQIFDGRLLQIVSTKVKPGILPIVACTVPLSTQVGFVSEYTRRQRITPLPHEKISVHLEAEGWIVMDNTSLFLLLEFTPK